MTRSQLASVLAKLMGERHGGGFGLWVLDLMKSTFEG